MRSRSNACLLLNRKKISHALKNIRGVGTKQLLKTGYPLYFRIICAMRICNCSDEDGILISTRNTHVAQFSFEHWVIINHHHHHQNVRVEHATRTVCTLRDILLATKKQKKRIVNFVCLRNHDTIRNLLEGLLVWWRCKTLENPVHMRSTRPHDVSKLERGLAEDDGRLIWSWKI